MIAVNEFILVGKMIKKMPGQTSSGTEFTRIFIESERKTKDSTVTDHFEVGAWGPSVREAVQGIPEGSTVAIVGRVTSNTYTDKTGVRRLSYNLVADRITGDDMPVPTVNITEDDLPF